jgi:calcineurin-like phosphoesterase family protein
MGRNLYISDLHLGHKNVLAYDARPFTNIDEHDKYIINAWNETVNDDDTIYILGDMIWAKEQEWKHILSQLKGHKVLIRGNHDPHNFSATTKSYFDDIKDYKEVKDNGRNVVLSHYPIVCFNRHYYGEYHLYGHVHTSFEYGMMLNSRRLMEDLYDKPCNMYNVGAMLDYMDYRPRTLDEIVEGFKQHNHLGKKENFNEEMHEPKNVCLLCRAPINTNETFCEKCKNK